MRSFEVGGSSMPTFPGKKGYPGQVRWRARKGNRSQCLGASEARGIAGEVEVRRPAEEGRIGCFSLRRVTGRLRRPDESRASGGRAAQGGEGEVAQQGRTGSTGYKNVTEMAELAERADRVERGSVRWYWRPSYARSSGRLAVYTVRTRAKHGVGERADRAESSRPGSAYGFNAPQRRM